MSTIISFRCTLVNVAKEMLDDAKNDWRHMSKSLNQAKFALIANNRQLGFHFVTGEMSGGKAKQLQLENDEIMATIDLTEAKSNKLLEIVAHNCAIVTNNSVVIADQIYHMSVAGYGKKSFSARVVRAIIINCVNTQFLSHARSFGIMLGTWVSHATTALTVVEKHCNNNNTSKESFDSLTNKFWALFGLQHMPATTEGEIFVLATSYDQFSWRALMKGYSYNNEDDEVLLANRLFGGLSRGEIW